MSIWVGSANWTAAATNHLEFGAWISDPALAQAALEYVTAVIKISEPLGSAADRPSPELVAAEWDDDAFAELSRELEEQPDHDEE